MSQSEPSESPLTLAFSSRRGDGKRRVSSLSRSGPTFRFVQPSCSRDGKLIYAFQHWETEEFGNVVVFEVRSSSDDVLNVASGDLTP